MPEKDYLQGKIEGIEASITRIEQSIDLLTKKEDDKQKEIAELRRLIEKQWDRSDQNMESITLLKKEYDNHIINFNNHCKEQEHSFRTKFKNFLQWAILIGGAISAFSMMAAAVVWLAKTICVVGI